MKLKVTKDEYFKMISTPEHDKWFKNKMSELGFDDNKFSNEFYYLKDAKCFSKKTKYNLSKHESIDSIKRDHYDSNEFFSNHNSYVNEFNGNLYKNDYDDSNKDNNLHNNGYYHKGYSSNDLHNLNEEKLFSNEKRFVA